MSYAGLDLSRQRLDVHVLDEDGATVEVTAVRPDADALRTLAAHVLRHGQEVSAAVESMTGARFVHDQLELQGWDVAIGDAVKVKGLAPLAAKTDKIDARVLAELARRDLVPEIWLPTPDVRARAGACPVPSPPRPPPDGLEEPYPLDAHELRPSRPGRGPLRDRRSRAAREHGRPGALGLDAGHEPGHGRRPRRANRCLRQGTPRTRCRPPLDPAPHDRARCGLDPGLHHRLGDR